jgi:hypothetical protein
MNPLKILLVPALAAGGLAVAVDVPAQMTTNGATRSMPSGSSSGAMTRHYSGSSRGTGNWSGGSRHWNGGRHWGGHRHGHFGLYFGLPILWSGAYWGWPYYYEPYYYPPRVIYREVERVPAYPEGEISAPTTDVPPSADAPRQGPLYMNYCESAKAYYPKVTSCPEGWKFITPGS